MCFCTAPCESTTGHFAAKLILRDLPGGPPGAFQYSPRLRLVATASFGNAIQAAYAAVTRWFGPCFSMCCVEVDMEAYGGGNPPHASGGSIFGAAFLAFAKLACKCSPASMPDRVRALQIDRIGITAAGDSCGCFKHVEARSIEGKLQALGALAAISVAVIPHGQPGVPWRDRRTPQSHPKGIYRFVIEKGKSLPVIECSTGEECLRSLLLLQAESYLLGGS